MEPLQTASVNCPYCGESIEVLVDVSAGAQEYVEDCQVCCQPMVVALTVSASGGIAVAARRENP